MAGKNLLYLFTSDFKIIIMNGYNIEVSTMFNIIEFGKRMVSVILIQQK